MKRNQDLKYHDMGRFSALAEHHREFGGAGDGAESSCACHSRRGTPSIASQRNVSAPPCQCLLRPDKDLPDETPRGETILFFIAVIALASGAAYTWYAYIMAGAI